MPLVQKAAQLCEDEPGMLLVETHFGNLVRYLTDCPVISSMILITSQNYEKAREVEELLDQRPEYILNNRPDIKYVLVMKTHFDVPDQTRDKAGIYPLAGALLEENPKWQNQDIRRLSLLKIVRGGKEETYGGLFQFGS